MENNCEKGEQTKMVWEECVFMGDLVFLRLSKEAALVLTEAINSGTLITYESLEVFKNSSDKYFAYGNIVDLPKIVEILSSVSQKPDNEEECKLENTTDGFEHRLSNLEGATSLNYYNGMEIEKEKLSEKEKEKEKEDEKEEDEKEKEIVLEAKSGNPFKFLDAKPYKEYGTYKGRDKFKQGEFVNRKCEDRKCESVKIAWGNFQCDYEVDNSAGDLEKLDINAVSFIDPFKKPMPKFNIFRD